MFKFNFLPEDRREDEEPMSDEPLTVDVKQEFGSLDIGEVFLPREESRSKFEAYESDLVPNVYEGGFKTWECSHDLVDYLKCLVERCTEITTVLEVRQRISSTATISVDRWVVAVVCPVAN